MPDANAEAQNTPAAQEETPAKHAYAHLAEGSATEEHVDDEVDDSEQQPEPGKRASKPIQPRINELVRKQRDAEREAAYWRGVAQGKTPANAPSPAPAPAPAAAKPTKDNFQTYDEYVEALAEWKSDIKVRAALAELNSSIEKRESQQSAVQIKASRAKNWEERAAATREILTDFDDVLSAAVGAKIADHTADLLEDSPHGPAIAYKLAKDPDLLDKLNKLSPQAAAKEFGKMEAVFDGPATTTTSKSTPNASKAPKPPSTVQPRSSNSKDPSKMSMVEYAEWRKGQGLR